MSAPFEARYNGHCAAGCLEPIEQGDHVTYVDDKLVHAGCTNDASVKELPVVICETCWLAKPCGCDD